MSYLKACYPLSFVNVFVIYENHKLMKKSLYYLLLPETTDFPITIYNCS